MYRMRSKGFLLDPPAKVHPNIMFGPGFLLTKEFIEKNKITHIINCADPSAVAHWIPEHFKEKYAILHAVDSLFTDILIWYNAFETHMDKFLKDDECNIVYVNCQAGMNRSGFLTVAYCCKKFGYDYELICKAILMQRPCALANTEFQRQVKEYTKKHS